MRWARSVVHDAMLQYRQAWPMARASEAAARENDLNQAAARIADEVAQRFEEEQAARGRVGAEDLHGPPAYHLRGRTRLALPTDDSATHEIEAPPGRV